MRIKAQGSAKGWLFGWSISGSFVVLVIITLFCFVSSISAQPNVLLSQTPFSAGGVMVGAAGFPELKVTGNMVGGYGYRSFHRLLIGGEGAGIFGENSSGGFGMFTVGYTAWMRHSLQIYPFWGFGGGRFTVKEKENTMNFLFGIGLGADFLPSGESRGFIIGARIGYLARFDEKEFNTIYLTLTFGGGRRD